MAKTNDILQLLQRFDELGIAMQIDYQKFYLYSIITHSTAIEGSTVTEIENQVLFDSGMPIAGRTMAEQLMNLDLKKAYEQALVYAKEGQDISVELLCSLSALVMRNTGNAYNTLQGSFDASKGELRKLNVSAGFGGKSYMNYLKVPATTEQFCNWLNEQRSKINRSDVIAIYRLSFEAHWRLVTIHPWADGNGRMARLLMNLIQWELGVLPTIVYKEHKVSYIEVLKTAQEEESVEPFIEFMFSELASYLQENIHNFEKDNN